MGIPLTPPPLPPPPAPASMPDARAAIAQVAAARALHDAQYNADLARYLGYPSLAATPSLPPSLPSSPPPPPSAGGAPTPMQLPDARQVITQLAASQATPHQLPGAMPGIDSNLGGRTLTAAEANRPFGGGANPQDVTEANAKLAEVAAKNPDLNAPSAVPSVESQEQEARSLPLRVTHVLGQIIDDIDQYGRNQWAPQIADGVYAKLTGKPTLYNGIYQLDPSLQGEFKNVYETQGRDAAGKWLYEHMDPTSKFTFNTGSSPLNAIGTGELENLGVQLGKAGIPIAPHLLTAIDRAPNLPFVGAKLAVKKAVGVAHDLPLFEPVFNAMTDRVNPFAVSARGKLEGFSRNVQDSLAWLRNQGFDMFGFNHAAHDPFNPLPYGGYTPQSRETWAGGWDELHNQARQLNNPVSQVYALRAIETGRQAVARQTAQVAADVARIKSGDPNVLNEYGQAGVDFSTPDELVHDLYNNLHTYVQSIQHALHDQINNFFPFDTARTFTDPERQAAESVLINLHNSIHTDVMRTRDSIEKFLDMVENHNQANPNQPFNPMYLEQLKQSLFDLRNLNVEHHFENATQDLANVLTGGDVGELHKLIGAEGDAPVFRDFLHQLRTLRAQSLGEDAITAHLPDQLADFYRNHISYGLPKYVKQVTRDKLALGTTIQDFWRSNHYGQGIGQWLGYTPQELDQLGAQGIGIGDALRQKGVTSLRDLVDKLRGNSVVPAEIVNKLNALSARYDRSGDLMFDDALNLVGHRLVNAKTMELGPRGLEGLMTKAPQTLKDLAQAYKERLLLSPAYHLIVLPQELVTGALHGINPLEMTRYLIRGMRGSVVGQGADEWMPEVVKDAMRMRGLDELPRSISSGGFGSSMLTRREEVGGPPASLTANERLPWWVQAAIGGAHAVGLGAGNPVLTALNLLLHVPFNVFAMPKLVHANADMSRAVEVVLRSIPWLEASSHHLSGVAPDFLDRFEAALSQPVQRLGGTTPGMDPFAVPGAVGGPQLTDLNSRALIRQTVDRLRARNGNFSANDIADVASVFNSNPEVINAFYHEWLNHLQSSNNAGVDFANHIHFDYGMPTNLESTVSHLAPFYIWMFRLIPFMVSHMLERPGLLNALVQSERAMEEENRLKGRLSDKYNQMAEVPGGEGIASAATGQPGSELMVNPASLIIPGTGLFKSNTAANEPVLNQVLGAASGIGLEPYPTLPLLLNAASAESVAHGGPEFYNEPAGSVSRQAPVYNWANDNLLAPAAMGLSPLLNEQQLGFPVAQARLNTGNPDAWYQTLYNLPREAVGQRPTSWEDIATRRRLAEMSVENTHRPNNPLYTDAMNDPNNPLYLAAHAQIRNQDNDLGTLRYLLPFSLRATNPTAQAIEQQSSNADLTYGPQLAAILHRYLPSRYPLINAYAAANAMDQGMYEGGEPFPNSPLAFSGLSSPVAMQSLPELESYLLFVSDYHIPPDKWFNPQVISMWLRQRSAVDQFAQQVHSQPGSAVNPLTNPSALP